MREITEIILHCSATKEGKDYRLADIDRWHRQQGWDGCGYHYVIDLDGHLEHGRPLEKVGAHCLGHNEHSIGICYIGGLGSDERPKDTRTPQQKFTLGVLLSQLHYQFPRARIHGHREFAKKACPCFDAAEYRRWFEDDLPA